MAHLLNPAFVAAVIARTVFGYEDEARHPIPFPLLYVAVPVVLHRITREQLPRDARTRMTAWLQRTPEARVGFAARTREVAPFVREGLSFGIAARGLRISPDGGIEVGSGASPRRFLQEGQDDAIAEVNECLRRAGFVGKWLARAGSTSTIYALWGIRP